MRYFEIETLGLVSDQSRMVLRDEPEELGIDGSRLAMGEPIADRYPPRATMQVHPEDAGAKLTDLLGNSFNYLIMSSFAADFLVDLAGDDRVERLPFELLDPGGRLWSRDFRFVNPLACIEAMDAQASDVKYFRTGQIVHIRRLVLDPARLRDAPGLFRLKEDRMRYMVTEPVARGLYEQGFTNFVFRETPTSC